MKKILVKTGWRESSLAKYRNLWEEAVPHYIAPNLLDAVDWIEDHLKT
ncbi:hypothetical protein ACJTM1_18575 [Bacillus sp. GX]|nr:MULTISPECIES: hypothetical protein [Bacillus]MDA2025979.1 hypothetical protein [Bacillus cereus group sp. Bcc03]MDA2215757.1 hypothetical protein [Bacillus cereus group sp. Bc228]MDA2225867.1 hypothetical protein [Bacillus cereus group sp. Bc227]MDA2260083.1 hypothetical protein [Bacillus cereus group sp. Bc200]MDA2320203.1 hypothetical protein [Bacillus cereus group sp. Bc177]